MQSRPGVCNAGTLRERQLLAAGERSCSAGELLPSPRCSHGTEGRELGEGWRTPGRAGAGGRSRCTGTCVCPSVRLCARTCLHKAVPGVNHGPELAVALRLLAARANPLRCGEKPSLR